MTTQIAAQGFIWKEITWAPGLLERKNTTKSCLFRRYFLTEKKPERVIENKGDEFHIGRKTWKFKAAVRK